MSDPVNPDYYKFSNGVQLIDISENLTGNGAQIVQYVARATRVDGRVKGNPLEDLDKAAWFLARERKRLIGAVEAVAAPVEAPVARVFNVGDPEPADKETIAVKGVGDYWGTGAPTFRYGSQHGNGDYPGAELWWAVSVPRGDRTNGSWDYWLQGFGPLTEVL